MIMLLWLLNLLLMVSAFFIYDINKPYNLHTSLIRKVSELASFAIWIYFVRRRNKIKRILNKLFQLASDVQCPLLTKVCCFTTILVPFVGWLATGWHLQEKSCKSLMKYYTLNAIAVHHNNSCIVAQPVMLVYNLFRLALPTYFASMFVLLCNISRKLLRKHSSCTPMPIVGNSSSSFGNSLEQYFAQYWNLMIVLRSLEQEMSFPLFVLQLIDLAGLYGCLVRFANFDPNHSIKYHGAAVFMAARAILSLIFVNLAASSVNVADVKAREINEELWQNLLFSGVTVKIEKAISMLVYKGQSFAFTVWGCFRFTRKYILSTIACSLTYSLLIVQMYSIAKV
ncbi:uncharacterized protein CDAR_426901 [Caerostris darwini]|uniref:Gustatory receptor n=1 Tax=Caerostris darwini TaxID=1538125 RepID=A0AAV4R7X2_9ARAC|nr:uncharacterized protein CDAR_426901 [Caerostris darwini]